MKVPSPAAQGIPDYLLITVMALAPITANFTGPYALACYLVAAAYLAAVLLTDFPMGVVRLFSYRTLGGLEVISGAALMLSPFIAGFATANPGARTFFLVFGGGVLLLWLLTDWSGKVHSEPKCRTTPGTTWRAEKSSPNGTCRFALAEKRHTERTPPVKLLLVRVAFLAR